MDNLVAIHENLDLRTSFNAAVFACLTITFWAIARLGEFTIPKLNSFNPKVYMKYSNLNTNITNQHGNKVTTVFISWTKASKS